MLRRNPQDHKQLSKENHMSEIIVSEGGIQASDVVKYVESGGTHKITVATEDPSAIAARIDAQIFQAS